MKAILINPFDQQSRRLNIQETIERFTLWLSVGLLIVSELQNMKICILMMKVYLWTIKDTLEW